MAELTPTTTTRSSCCDTTTQASCCTPDAKSECCDSTAHAAGTCGCSAGPAPAEAEDIRETVRAKYAAAARAAAAGAALPSSCCAPSEVALNDPAGVQVFGDTLYTGADTDGATAGAVAASLGCGVPTAVADLREGETVLDLGSGAGTDVLISARRVGVTGVAIGLDMTDEMLDLARANAVEACVENVRLVKGTIEEIPLPDACVDVVISNCVINLSGDKPQVIREVARVLKPGGRFAVSDVIADPDMDDATRADVAAWTGCIAGALTREEFESALTAAGLGEVEIRETHRVHASAVSAIVRASKPATAAVRCDAGRDQRVWSRRPARAPRRLGPG